MTINFTADELNFILQVLGELPTKSGAFTVVQNITKQVQEQQKAQAPEAE